MNLTKILKSMACLLTIAGIGSAAHAQELKATTEAGTVTVTAISDNIVRVIVARPNQPVYSGPINIRPDMPYGTTGYDPNQAPRILTTLGGLVVTLDPTSGDVVINGGANKVVTSGISKALNNGMQELTLYTTAPGSFYGAGKRGHSINLRGDTLTMYNRQNYGYTKGDPRINQMNISMPLVLSSDGFAILFDDYSAAELYLGNDSEIKYTTEGKNAITYYYINGKGTIADIVTELSSLTGRQPLPPLWSLGYITSKYGYHNEKETIGAIDSLKTRGFPVDGIVLDLYWYGKEQDMGRLAWEPEQWPNPEKMLADLKKQNVNLIAISQPYVLRNGKAIDNYNYLAENGMLMLDSVGKGPQEVKIWVGEGGMLDVSNPETRKWLANKYHELTEMGITGWWGDLGEPEVHPQEGTHANGLNARLYHNMYGNDWSKIIYDMWQEEYPDTRLVTMMRGGTTGLQQYSVFPWSTDVSRSWGGLQPQVTIMLNSGLSGMGYMGHDVGGFAVDKENPEDAELYVRWLQLGTFSPMLRTHAQYKAEPYHYPEYKDIILNLIKERYRWLPYNYTLAYENAAFGYPLVRPLNFYEAGSNAYDLIDDEYLWGSEVLVAPVMVQGATERDITFPQGQWVDILNPKQVYVGGSTVTYPAPLEVLPMFVKAGAFLPMAEYKMESTADYNPAKLTVDYYPVDGVESSYTLYDDDRVSAKALANKQYRLITFKGNDEEGKISIEISAEGTYAGAPASIDITMALQGIGSMPESITVDGKKVKGKITNGALTFPVKFISGKATSIDIISSIEH